MGISDNSRHTTVCNSGAIVSISSQAVFALNRANVPTPLLGISAANVFDKGDGSHLSRVGTLLGLFGSITQSP